MISHVDKCWCRCHSNFRKVKLFHVQGVIWSQFKRCFDLTPIWINLVDFYWLSRQGFLIINANTENLGLIIIRWRIVSRKRVSNNRAAWSFRQPAIKRPSADVDLQSSEKSPRKNFSDFNNLPAHERVFHILSSRIIIASKCDKSPSNLNTFILCVCWFKLWS